MNIAITEFKDGSTHSYTRQINHLPDTCSICHHSGTLTPSGGYINLHGNGIPHTERRMQLIVQCPRHDCKRYAIAYYAPTDSTFASYSYTSSLPHTPQEFSFSDSIHEISPEFIEIYRQATEAESAGLDKIAGVGYRKGLEFLIKDYLIYTNPDDADSIKEKALGVCINEHVADSRLKTVSERAVWLGNDETHYMRKWNEKDIKDLKSLITLSTYWIDSEYLTAKLVEDMPKPSKKTENPPNETPKPSTEELNPDPA